MSKKMATNGVFVFMTHTIPSNSMEAWVRSVAKDSKQKVDWHFCGGRAVVLTLGDVKKVQASIEKLLPDHDARFQAACSGFISGGPYKPPRPDWLMDRPADDALGALCHVVGLPRG